jgi:hypothetical protein
VKGKMEMVRWEHECTVSSGMKLFWGSLIIVFLLPSLLGTLLTHLFLPGLIAGSVALGFLVLALLLTPKRLICSEDRLIIQLWAGISKTVPIENINGIEKLPKRDVLYCMGLPLRSAWTTPVLISRKKGCTIMLTPDNPDELIDQITALMAQPRHGN